MCTLYNLRSVQCSFLSFHSIIVNFVQCLYFLPCSSNWYSMISNSRSEISKPYSSTYWPWMKLLTLEASRTLPALCWASWRMSNSLSRNNAIFYYLVLQQCFIMLIATLNPTKCRTSPNNGLGHSLINNYFDHIFRLRSFTKFSFHHKWNYAWLLLVNMVYCQRI